MGRGDKKTAKGKRLRDHSVKAGQRRDRRRQEKRSKSSLESGVDESIVIIILICNVSLTNDSRLTTIDWRLGAYGANRILVQPPSSSIVYRILSCSRLVRPCQNSMASGMTTYPPQCAGRLTIPFSRFFFDNLQIDHPTIDGFQSPGFAEMRSHPIWLAKRPRIEILITLCFR